MSSSPDAVVPKHPLLPEGAKGSVPFKVVLLGRLGVGRTSLLQKLKNPDWKLSDDACGAAASSTVTSHFVTKRMDDGTNVRFVLNDYDIGSDLGANDPVGNVALNGAHAIVMVVDASDANTLNDVGSWKEKCYWLDVKKTKKRPHREDRWYGLIATKGDKLVSSPTAEMNKNEEKSDHVVVEARTNSTNVDPISKRQMDMKITLSMIRTFTNLGIVSAATGDGVREAFDTMFDEIYHYYYARPHAYDEKNPKPASKCVIV